MDSNFLVINRAVQQITRTNVISRAVSNLKKIFIPFSWLDITQLIFWLMCPREFIGPKSGAGLGDWQIDA